MRKRWWLSGELHVNGFSKVSALALSAALIFQASPASAVVVSKTDPVGDAIPRLDITRVTYTNAPGPVRVRIVVPDLQRLGTARYTIAPPDSDVAYVASVTFDGQGRMSKRFSWQPDVSNVPKPCAFKVKWRPADGYIKLTVPRACLKN